MAKGIIEVESYEGPTSRKGEREKEEGEKVRQRKKKRGKERDKTGDERGEERNRQTAALERGHSEGRAGGHHRRTDRQGWGEGRSGSL